MGCWSTTKDLYSGGLGASILSYMDQRACDDWKVKVSQMNMGELICLDLSTFGNKMRQTCGTGKCPSNMSAPAFRFFSFLGLGPKLLKLNQLPLFF